MITDNMLVGVAKLVGGESFTIPAYLAISSDSSFSVSATTDSISGELGSRESLSVSRVDKVVSFSAVRSGTVASSSGDVLYGFGFMPLSTGDGCQVAVELPGLEQTQSFDIDFNVDLTIRRV